jgi:hypothetical protein
MRETIADLERRRALLKEIRVLAEEIALLEIPSDNGMEAVAGYVGNLRELESLDEPDADAMGAIAQHVKNLEALENHEAPDEDEVRTASQHLATLEAIAEADMPSDEEIEKAQGISPVSKRSRKHELPAVTIRHRRKARRPRPVTGAARRPPKREAAAKRR